MARKKFKLNEAEYKEFTKQVMVKSKLKIIIVTGLIVLAVGAGFSYKDGFPQALINGVALAVAYALIVMLGLFVFAPMFVKKAYKKNNIDSIQFDYEILETGIKQGKNMFLYEHFTKIKEGKYSYFLYLEDKQVVLIPKRIFSDEERKDFIKLVSKKIKTLKLKNTNKL